MSRQLRFNSKVIWTGNLGTGTSAFKAYTRDFVIGPDGKPEIPGTTAPAFGGDAARYDPEDLLVASLSSCHMLWYLHLASQAGVVVTAYRDSPEGTLGLEKGGAGQFSEVVLKPQVTIAATSDEAIAERLHEQAHELCFIARSVNFPVRCEPVILKS